uniref:uncharacterized protein LOC117248467 n=1 Tax=Epinephelus lanceolatus TaxID=310571 RepID=UPI001447EBC4|nr:uncharacterized protein LOC117248467 [Epinephelus lanceolatus]
MDLVDICAATSRGDNKRRVNKKNTVWQKRPHLRKTAVQPLTMQSEDKHGPKKIAEEWEQSTVWPSSKKPPQGTQQGQHRTNDSGNTLRFTCSQCRDNLEYVPKDLVKHFEEKHRGSPPVFSCHLCAFRTHEFSFLQVHLLSHKDTFSSCSICHDNVQRTWPEFSGHLTMYHCQNGKYACDMCQKFSTGDVRLFLEHTYAHDLCRAQRTEKSLQLLGLEGANDLSLHVKGENKYGPKTTTRSLRCQHCDYATSHKWLLTRHVKAIHFCRNGNRSKRKKKEDKWTKASETDLDDPSEAIASSPQSKPGEELTPSCAAKPMGSKNVDRNTPVVLEGLPSSHQEMQDDTEKSLQLLGLEGGNNLSLHVKGENKYGPKTTTRSLRCQHCDYATSYKWLLTKHVKAVHFCQNGNQSKKKKKKEEVRSIAMKQNDPVPKIKPRLTRSAVREMCWLTEDCLSLPGREFLDKYCHLSDPQTTLEETQQFLMKSVAGENGNQKWTKALKTVLSNVPQDMNLHPRSENGIVSNSSDLTVLTVKNKITVAQNGATYAKRLKMMTSSDKETPESTPDDARCVVDQNECQSNLSNHTPCPQTETKLNNFVSMPVHSEPSECTQMQENRENQELKIDQEIKEYNKKPEEPMHEDGIDISSELKLTNDSEEQIHKVAPKKKRRRRKRKARPRTVAKRASGVALKIVLKKNPVKEKQWVSQSSLSPSGGGLMDEYHGLPSPHTTTEETVQVLQNKLLIKAHQKKWTKASETDLDDPSEAIASSPQSKPGEELTPSCAAKPMGYKNMDRNTPVVLEGLPSTHQEMRDDTEKSLQLLEAEVDESGSACMTAQSDVRTEVEMCPENVQLRTSGSGTECHVSDNEMSSAADGATPHSSYTKSSPVSQPVITAHGNALISEHSDQSVEVVRDREVPTDPCPDLLSNTNLPAGKAILQDPSPAPVHQRQPFPKNLERTLKLVAINPSQLVKRPAGDQPVVVLNHPDADIPEVARIMEVINRYRGEVQKVVLSRRTMNALSAMDGKVPEMNDSSDAQPDSPGCAENPVQERFMLKLKLRRLSRKKYEVVGAVSPSGDVARKFRCWFCGRAFASEETWMVHRQRHLMEWKGPNCENS